MTPTPGHAKMPSSDELIVQIANNTRIMAVKLFGSSDADDENTTGRLPKVEHSAKRAHIRIDEMQEAQGVRDRKAAFRNGMTAAISGLVSAAATAVLTTIILKSLKLQ